MANIIFIAPGLRIYGQAQRIVRELGFDHKLRSHLSVRKTDVARRLPLIAKAGGFGGENLLLDICARSVPG